MNIITMILEEIVHNFASVVIIQGAGLARMEILVVPVKVVLLK